MWAVKASKVFSADPVVLLCVQGHSEYGAAAGFFFFSYCSVFPLKLSVSDDAVN